LKFLISVFQRNQWLVFFDFLRVSVLRRASKSCFFSQISFPPLKRWAIFMRPACAGLAHISANQFKSAFISVELLVVATPRCASVVGFAFDFGFEFPWRPLR
jgi:hypothetical protein